MLSNQRLPDGVYIQTINTTSINSITPKRNVNGFIALYYFKILLPQKANPTENKTVSYTHLTLPTKLEV